MKAPNYEKRMADFREALGNNDMDADVAFDFFADIHDEYVRQGESARYAALVADFRRRAPQVYEEISPFLLCRLISDALAAEDTERTCSLAREMAVEGEKDGDVFFRTLHELCLHGQMSVLLQMMPIAWEWIGADRGGLMGYAVDEFRELGISLEMADWADRNPNGNDTEALSQRLSRYGEMAWPRVLTSMGILTGQTKAGWSPEDFAGIGTPRTRKQDDDRDPDEDNWEDDGPPSQDPDLTWKPATSARPEGPRLEGWDRCDPHDNLFLLTLDFAHAAHVSEGLATSTLVLACDNLRQYLLDRQSEGPDRPKKARGRSRSARRVPVTRRPNVLLPDESSLDRWGGELLAFPFPQSSRAAAVLLVLPAWLRFLAVRGLAPKADTETAFASLQPLVEKAAQVLADGEVAPAVIVDLRHRWDLSEAST